MYHRGSIIHHFYFVVVELIKHLEEVSVVDSR